MPAQLFEMTERGFPVLDFRHLIVEIFDKIIGPSAEWSGELVIVLPSSDTNSRKAIDSATVQGIIHRVMLEAAD
jgi:hypothetical protein